MPDQYMPQHAQPKPASPCRAKPNPTQHFCFHEIPRSFMLLLFVYASGACLRMKQAPSALTPPSQNPPNRTLSRPRPALPSHDQPNTAPNPTMPNLAAPNRTLPRQPQTLPCRAGADHIQARHTKPSLTAPDIAHAHLIDPDLSRPGPA